jgi:hypothetical protein
MTVLESSYASGITIEPNPVVFEPYQTVATFTVTAKQYYSNALVKTEM